ncbi:DegT/DnrJ/EryC1/StrS family aminotransferase [Candidatus Woesearchaeota archaeon]|nr:DegT/DnrJ/EryC1/StrS family aminotransferase [Candidatus Woesearchaeota archaeon]
MEEKLALFGGEPTFTGALPITNTIGVEEKEAVNRVMDRGILSSFVGRWDDRFYGGPEVRRFESIFAQKFKVNNAVSFNSATTALQAAIAAAGIGPGDEVITSPYTMSATASCILANHAIPIFADIDEHTFCLDPVDVRKKITPRTKAILSVNIFGHVPDYDQLLAIAREHGLLLIEDCAQSPAAFYKGRYAGTIGDMGVFSFNFHKTMHCGEGGVLVTQDERLAFRAQLVRNHGEVVLDEVPVSDSRKQEIVLGSNYRLSELHAAIATEQLQKLDFLTKARVALADYLTLKLKGIPGLESVFVRSGCTHVYYIYPLKYDENYWGFPRSKFAQALKAEGAPIAEGYVKPLYLIPLYQRRKMYPRTAFPFVSLDSSDDPHYQKGSCPVAERMYEKELLTTNICRYPLTRDEIDRFISAIQKIDRHKRELRS